MSQAYEELLSSLFEASEVTMAEQLEKEAHRIYLSAKIEMYEERLGFLRKAIDESMSDKSQNVSPFMFGFVEGMRRALAFIINISVDPLQKPPAWYNDLETERLIMISHRYRRHVRRAITRLMWIMLYTHHRCNVRAVAKDPAFFDRLVREAVNGVLKDIPASYTFRMRRKQLIELTGVKYEKVRNAKPLEGGWA